MYNNQCASNEFFSNKITKNTISADDDSVFARFLIQKGAKTSVVIQCTSISDTRARTIHKDCYHRRPRAGNERKVHGYFETVDSRLHTDLVLKIAKRVNSQYPEEHRAWRLLTAFDIYIDFCTNSRISPLLDINAIFAIGRYNQTNEIVTHTCKRCSHKYAYMTNMVTFKISHKKGLCPSCEVVSERHCTCGTSKVNEFGRNWLCPKCDSDILAKRKAAMLRKQEVEAPLFAQVAC